MTLEQKIQSIEKKAQEKIQRAISLQWQEVENTIAIGFYVNGQGEVSQWNTGRNVRALNKANQFQLKSKAGVHTYNLSSFTGKIVSPDGDRYFLKGIETDRESVVVFLNAFKGQPLKNLYASLGGHVEPSMPLI